MSTKPTLREIVELAKGASEEQLDAPVEVLIRTWTGKHATYPIAFEIGLTSQGAGDAPFGQLRVWAAYPEGFTVHERKVK
jgi:hypothetical protein